MFGLTKTGNLDQLTVAKLRESRYDINECSTSRPYVHRIIPYIISVFIICFNALYDYFNRFGYLLEKRPEKLTLLAAKQKSKTDSTSVIKQPTPTVKRNSSNTNPYTPLEIQQALIVFQRFFGLPKTGNLDTLTVAKLREPRCGVNECSTTRPYVQNIFPYLMLSRKSWFGHII